MDLDVEHAVPKSVVEFDYRNTVPGHRICRVVNQDIDRPQFSYGLLHDPSGLGAIAQIGDDGHGAASQGTHLFSHAIDISPPHRLLIVREGAG